MTDEKPDGRTKEGKALKEAQENLTIEQPNERLNRIEEAIGQLGFLVKRHGAIPSGYPDLSAIMAEYAARERGRQDARQDRLRELEEEARQVRTT